MLMSVSSYLRDCKLLLDVDHAGHGYKITIRLPFDSHSIRPRYDYSTTYVTTASLPVCGPLHCGLNRSAWLRLADYVTVTLMTFDKQSNGRRIEVKS